MIEKKNSDKKKPFRFGCLQVLGIMAVLSVVIVLLTVWWIKYNMYAKLFTPTELTVKEQQVLDQKLERLEVSALKEEKFLDSRSDPYAKDESLKPEPYSEDDVLREISITEKELNALIAKKEGEMAKRVAIDLSEDLVSIKLLVPMNNELPVIGGKTLRLNCGVTLRYEEGKPVVVIRGVSVGGVPLPGAWWGNIKNTNLVQKFGDEGGFWDRFSKGIADIKVRDGHLWIKLKE